VIFFNCFSSSSYLVLKTGAYIGSLLNDVGSCLVYVLKIFIGNINYELLSLKLCSVMLDFQSIFVYLLDIIQIELFLSYATVLLVFSAA